MSKVVVTGDVVVITSSQKLSALQELEKYNPEALKLYEVGENGERKPVFRVSVGENPSVSKLGVVFTSEARDGSGLATVTLPIPKSVTDAKEWLVEEYGSTIERLKEVEDTLNSAIDAMKTAKQSIRNNITVA